MMAADARYEVDRIGVFTPKMKDAAALGPGEMGFITAQIKQVADTRVGDTITDEKKPCAQALPGFKPVQPVVFCGLFPVDAADFEDLRAAVGRNSGSTTPASPTRWSLPPRSASASAAAFLGLLHLEIIQERLEREFNLDLIATAPSVVYEMKLRDGARSACTTPPTCPTPRRSSPSRSRGSAPPSSRRTNTSATC